MVFMGCCEISVENFSSIFRARIQPQDYTTQKPSRQSKLKYFMMEYVKHSTFVNKLVLFEGKTSKPEFTPETKTVQSGKCLEYLRNFFVAWDETCKLENFPHIFDRFRLLFYHWNSPSWTKGYFSATSVPTYQW